MLADSKFLSSFFYFFLYFIAFLTSTNHVIFSVLLAYFFLFCMFCPVLPYRLAAYSSKKMKKSRGYKSDDEQEQLRFKFYFHSCLFFFANNSKYVEAKMKRNENPPVTNVANKQTVLLMLLL